MALMSGLIGTYMLNAFKRSWLRLFFDRALLYNVADTPAFLSTDKWPLQRTALTDPNFRQAASSKGCRVVESPTAIIFTSLPEKTANA